jgi:hypothetical protein
VDRLTRSDVLRASPPLFDSRLDRLTRSRPVVPLLLFAPVIIVLSALGLALLTP